MVAKDMSTKIITKGTIYPFHLKYSAIYYKILLGLTTDRISLQIFFNELFGNSYF